MAEAIALGLHAAVVTLDGNRPLVLTVEGSDFQHDGGRDGHRPALPFGPFQPEAHRTLEAGLRQWVETQTQLRLGYVEQLYTFGDAGRLRDGGTPERADPAHFVSVGYLALVRAGASEGTQTTLRWRNWYQFFPWEDWRTGEPPILAAAVLPALTAWALQTPDATQNARALERLPRFRLAFGCDLKADGSAQITAWDEERVLERYELMYEAGLIQEAVDDGRFVDTVLPQPPGEAMLYDHRRILATAIARLRGKLKYRPVVFELMNTEFTLTDLQKTVETLSGQRVHKQNFRRLVEKADLVEPTGTSTAQTGGRPAANFRFRRSVTLERPAPGLKIAPAN
ncbi:MAG: NAD regulator [Pseudomonadota bacterium]